MPMPTRPGAGGVKLSHSEAAGAMVSVAGSKVTLAIGGTQRIGEEGVLDVRHSELEVLLLVLEAERVIRRSASSSVPCSSSRAMPASTCSR